MSHLSQLCFMQIYTLDMKEMTKPVKLTAPGLLYYYKHYVGWLIEWSQLCRKHFCNVNTSAKIMRFQYI